jgi:membrane fusion protein
VTTTEANVRVFAPSAGVISDLYVVDGESVSKGQALARLSTSTSTDGASSVQSSILKSMREEAATLRQQIAHIGESATHRKSAVERQIENVLYQIGVMKEQLVTARERLALAEKDYHRVAELRQQSLVSEVDVDRSRASALDIKLGVDVLERELSDQRNKLEQLRLDAAQLPITTSSERAQLQAGLQQIEQRIAGMMGQDSIVVVAPIDGRISDLGRRVGQQISESTPIVSVLPIHTSYYAELFVPSRSIGFVREGADIQVRYDAFPHQKFGVFSGRVIRVATTPIRPHEADAPIELFELSYLLTASLDEQHIDVDGTFRELQTGMILQADIVRDRRRIIEWMIEPIIGAAKRTQ